MHYPLNIIDVPCPSMYCFFMNMRLFNCNVEYFSAVAVLDDVHETSIHAKVGHTKDWDMKNNQL